MKTKTILGLLIAALLVLKGTCAYAGEPVTVESGETTATLTWPTDSAANKYQIDIYKDGETFCHLTLGPKGQLLGITFNAPRRREDSSFPESVSFMVTGLDAASRYNYVLSAVRENGTPVHVYFGDFATTGYPGDLTGGWEVIPTPPIIPGNPEAKPTTGVETVTGDGLSGTQKVLKDGILLFRMDGKTYSITGQRVD